MTNHIFISYSSQDREFALRLADDLEKMFSVWIDREGLEGGVEWQEQIQAAITACAVFVVVVSPYSNQSDWVNRETLLADQLKKMRVPILIEGTLPFRLLDLQYIDFQGAYAGGLRDLIEVLSKYLDPSQQRSDESNRMLGAGVRAYLAGDQTEADRLVGEALAFQPEIAESVTEFWLKLRGQDQAGPSAAARLMDEISVIERAREAGAYPSGDIMVEWQLYLDAPDTILNEIEYVKYILHETFAVPEQIVRDRTTHFRLTQRGWGQFIVFIKIHFKDGSVGETKHMLIFRLSDG